MNPVIIPPEIVSLVHHIELNKEGWWEKALQQLILAAVWLSNGNISAQEIIDYYLNQFKINLDSILVNSQINSLCLANTLVPMSGNKYRISEVALKNFEQKLDEAEEIEKKCKKQFFEIIDQCCPSLKKEQTWEEVNKGLILPIIRSMGARTYELLSGGEISLGNNINIHDYILKYPAEHRKSLQSAITLFLNPKDKSVRSYILNYLNSFFFLEAGNLTEDTIKSITRLDNKKPQFLVFVDTNFLFSILGLHENPSNEAAIMLQGLISQLSQKIDIKLYVTPSTIEEAKKVLNFHINQLSPLRLTPYLAEASLDYGMSGVVQKYFDVVKRNKIAVSAEAYFDPYIKNLISILKTKNVDLFNEGMVGYKKDQKVIDDILSQIEFEKEKPVQSPKGYMQWEHDIMLWHFVRDKRPRVIESPLEAIYWIATIDFRFLGFDAYKRKQLNEAFQICVHPSTLIQMLQLWIPRTEQFEEAMLSSLRLPFLFREFDSDSERVTLHILEVLSRFENVEDLSKETITATLMNNALRQKLSAESDVKKQVELVRESLIDENKKTQAQLQKEVARAKLLQDEIGEKEQTIREMENKVADLEEKLSDTESKLAKEHDSRTVLEERITQLEENEHARAQKEKNRMETKQFVWRWVIVPLTFIALLGFFAPRYINFIRRFGIWGPALGIWCLSLIILILLVDKKSLNYATIRSTKLFIIFLNFKRRLFGILAAILLGVIVNSISDYIKRFLHF